MSEFKRGLEFPNEGFVQKAIEAHFTARGFEKTSKDHVDLVVQDLMTGERWIIEAKGATTAIGLDFRTGIGQLIQAMDEENARYGLAFPDIDPFRRQARKVPARVRSALSIEWIIVRENGDVVFVGPDDSFD